MYHLKITSLSSRHLLSFSLFLFPLHPIPTILIFAHLLLMVLWWILSLIWLLFYSIYLFSFLFLSLYFFKFLYTSFLLLHSTFSLPIYDMKFTFSLCPVPIPYSYYGSSLYPPKIIFLLVSHLIFIFPFL